MAMDYNAPQNVGGEVVAELCKQGRGMAAFAELMSKVHHVDTKITNNGLRIQGWIPVSSFLLDFPKDKTYTLDVMLSVGEMKTSESGKIAIIEIWCCWIPLWYFNKEGAYEAAMKIPHEGIVLTEQNFKV